MHYLTHLQYLLRSLSTTALLTVFATPMPQVSASPRAPRVAANALAKHTDVASKERQGQAKPLSQAVVGKPVRTKRLGLQIVDRKTAGTSSASAQVSQLTHGESSTMYHQSMSRPLSMDVIADGQQGLTFTAARAMAFRIASQNGTATERQRDGSYSKTVSILSASWIFAKSKARTARSRMTENPDGKVDGWLQEKNVYLTPLYLDGDSKIDVMYLAAVAIGAKVTVTNLDLQLRNDPAATVSQVADGTGSGRLTIQARLGARLELKIEGTDGKQPETRRLVIPQATELAFFRATYR